MKQRPILVVMIMMLSAILSGFTGPWYAQCICILLIACLLRLNVRQGIGYGALSLLLVYVTMTILMSQQDDAGIISKVGGLLGGLSSTALIVVTSILGGISGLLSGWLGAALGNVIWPAGKA